MLSVAKLHDDAAATQMIMMIMNAFSIVYQQLLKPISYYSRHNAAG